MAKKRAADDLLCSSPKKCRGLCSVDMRLDSVAASGVVSPPSLLALLGGRCRKRPLYFDETEETDFDFVRLRKGAHGELQMKHSAHLNHTMQGQHIPGNLPPNNSKSTNKRTRNDCEESADTDNSKDKAKVDAKTEHEDSSFNSFQFWRIPLPELDMSLLQELPKKDLTFEDMET